MRWNNVYVGHINLAKSFNDTGKHFVSLVEALQRAGMRQYVLVRNVTLAKRIGAVDNVVVGPVVRSAVTAFSLMPRVDVAHMHCAAAGQAGLLLALTRSIPYVLSHTGPDALSRNPFTLAIYRRAGTVLCRDDGEASILRHYDPSLCIETVPIMEDLASAGNYVRVYQNSQRIPMAGSNGIQ